MKKRFLTLKNTYRITPPARKTWIPERHTGVQDFAVYPIPGTNKYDVSSLNELLGLKANDTRTVTVPSGPVLTASRLVDYLNHRILNHRILKDWRRASYSLGSDNTIIIHVPVEHKEAHWQPRPLGEKLSSIFPQKHFDTSKTTR